MRIGVDLAGSDSAPDVLWKSAVDVAQELAERAELVLIGREPVGACGPGLTFYRASEEIGMDEAPLSAIRTKKNSSLVVGFRLLAEGEIQGLVSAGNTGAIIAGAALKLHLLPRVTRPALLATLPTLTGSVAVVDIGGNVVVRPRHLVEFARMGVAYQRCAEKIPRPRVGLLNIGTESRKGTVGVREAYEMLQSQSNDFEFVGNIEGREVFSGAIDVLVCDGFAGNIFLKTAEGISSFIFDSMEGAFADKLGKEALGTLKQLNRRVNYAEYPGAIVCGVHGVVVKCHGFSSLQALRNGIRGAAHLVEQDFTGQLARSLSEG